MFIPLGDDNSDRQIRPLVNYLLIAVNIIVFIFLQDMGRNIPFTFAYSTVPAEILTGQDVVTSTRYMEDPYTGHDFVLPGLEITPIPVYLTLLTSMFMHGGIAHVFGNMLYLWIAGDNLENVMGHVRYLFFYLLTGIIAALSHVISSEYFGENPLIPSLGASGAISGVLGGYILLFPSRRVHLWMLFGTISVPAIIAVGVWFAFQLLNGLGTLGGQEAGGVAYAAHIGGFIAGLLLCKLFVKRPAIANS